MQVGIAVAKDRKSSRIVEAFTGHCRVAITKDHIPGMIAPVDAGPAAQGS
jgi:hypothetical protein